MFAYFLFKFSVSKAITYKQLPNPVETNVHQIMTVAVLENPAYVNTTNDDSFGSKSDFCKQLLRLKTI